MESLQQVARDLAAHGIAYLEDEPLKLHTSFHVGGPAALFCSPAGEEQLAFCIAAACRYKVPHVVLGRGSNVLFRDEGYQGLVIHIGEALGSIAAKGSRLCAGAGAQLAEVCLAAKGAGLSGLEFAYGIPGSVGGAVFMNAGAYGGEISQVLQGVRCLNEDLKPAMLDAQHLELGYRTSVFQRRPWVVVAAVFALEPAAPGHIEALMNRYHSQRTTRQPLEYPSAGSTFKRPQGAYAGALIEQSGLRGYRIGGAAVSEKHCGFIVNVADATCADVLALADYVAGVVREKTGYHLEKEIRLIDERDTQ